MLFGSTMLEVAIGVIFVYLLVSLLCSALSELLESFLRYRYRDLERGIGKLLDDPNLAKMNDDAIVFAMANPTPEVMPEEAAPYVRIMATGRSDYPNQINNVLCFPGIFRGALACRASRINEEMKLAAAQAIASIITPEELHPEYIVPSVFDKRVAEAVAREVEEAAYRTGVARRERAHTDVLM